MTTITPTTPSSTSNARLDAIESLHLALRRYERMASMPRKLQLPLCGDLDAIVRAERRARDQGQVERADVLADWCEREMERRDEQALWKSGQRGRSRKAWVAIARRLHVALHWCIAVDAIHSDDVVYARDRLQDAEARIRRCDLEAQRARLN